MPHDKLIPINDLVQLITDAGVSHQRGIYATSLSKLTVRGGDPLAALSTAYELAASLGIPEERMDEVIANRYPSVEAQLGALEHQGAVATTKAVAKTYQMEIENTLRSALDEIDKIAGRESGQGPDVSREGVQRDILPIVEGTNVVTRYGMVRTDHILFIAAGAFHATKPSDLIPEFQGRFPIRVEMNSLGEEDFVRILTEPRNALIKQYRALLKTESIRLRFTRDAVREIARLACVVNDSTENIGGRRLHTVMETLLEEISFKGASLKNKNAHRRGVRAGKAWVAQPPTRT